jgi:hypothetical protein
MQSIKLEMDVLRVARGRHQRSGAQCPRCLEALTVHQPDVELPDRLLGICMKCRGWFLIDAAVGVIVRLPDQAELRDA